MSDTRASHPGGFAADPALFRQRFPHRAFEPEQFSRGNRCAAVLIGPNLLAVATDLRTDPAGKRFPCLKIVSQPVEELSLGDRVACCALYYVSRAEGRWTTFDPLAVNCATADPELRERLRADLDFAELEAMLAATEGPYEADLQFVFSPDLSQHAKEIVACAVPLPDPRFPSSPESTFHGSLKTLTFIMGMFLAVSVWALVDSKGQDPAVDGISAGFWGLYLTLAWLLWRMTVKVHAEGFSWQGPRTPFGSARWEDVFCYTARTARESHYGLDQLAANQVAQRTRWRFSTAYGATWFTVYLRDGRQVKLSTVYGRATRLFGAIIDHFDPLVLEDLKKHHRHGLGMPFGKMTCYPDHLRWGEERIALADIDSARAIDGLLRLKVRGVERSYLIHNPYALESFLSS